MGNQSTFWFVVAVAALSGSCQRKSPNKPVVDTAPAVAPAVTAVQPDTGGVGGGEVTPITPVGPASLPGGVAPAAPVFAPETAHAYQAGTSASVSGVAPVGTVVDLFDDAACAGAIVQSVSASVFGAGVAVTVPLGTVRRLYAKARDASGLASDCTATPASMAALGWTLVSGLATANDPGTYGTPGVADAANRPAARGGYGAWATADGSLWIFGGNGANGHWGALSDMWRLDAATGIWTWMSGAATDGSEGNYGTLGQDSATTTPPHRAAQQGWTGADGALYMFSGFSGSGPLTDMWRFDPATGRWRWIAGSNVHANAPSYGALGVEDASNQAPSRLNGATWTDAAGDLWLFGGDTNGLGLLSDLWRFKPSTARWTWMGGSAATNQVAVYGVKGKADAASHPGGREVGCVARGEAGKVWLFGGSGYASDPVVHGLLNDLWSYDQASAKWTWVSGDDGIDKGGVFGARGIAAAASTPGARRTAGCWVDGAGRFWVFGGIGFDAAGANGQLDDVWVFEPTTGEWAWVTGAKDRNAVASFGLAGVANPGDDPGGRQDIIALPLPSRHEVVIFGGHAFVAGGNGFDVQNDAWRLPVP